MLHAGSIVALAVSADGRCLASAGRDHIVRVWDLATGARRLGPSLPSPTWLKRLAAPYDGDACLVALGPAVLPLLADMPEARDHYEAIAADIALCRSQPDFERVWD